jgi:hypothetical protein
MNIHLLYLSHICYCSPIRTSNHLSFIPDLLFFSRDILKTSTYNCLSRSTPDNYLLKTLPVDHLFCPPKRDLDTATANYNREITYLLPSFPHRRYNLPIIRIMNNPCSMLWSILSTISRMDCFVLLQSTNSNLMIIVIPFTKQGTRITIAIASTILHRS